MNFIYVTLTLTPHVQTSESIVRNKVISVQVNNIPLSMHML